VLIGSDWRVVKLGPLHRHRTLSLRLRIRGHTLTVRARGIVIRPRIAVRLRPLKTAPAQPEHASPPLVASATTGAGASSATVSAAPTITVPAGFVPVESYTSLVKDYEFTGSSLPANWSAGIYNYGYEATQYQPSQVTMSGGSADLTAISKASPDGDPYESGWISTAGSYTVQYGLIDFRAEMPAGQGLWSGLWLTGSLGADPWGEIDDQEMLLGNAHAVYGSLHDWTSSATQIWGETHSTNMAADASQGFHDYQVVWQPGMITWAVDGVAYAQYTQAEAEAQGETWPFNSVSDFLIADLAVAGSSEWGGPPNSSTVFPATLKLQSVKVWQ
jgi:beta-glucanase (GH16 family)